MASKFTDELKALSTPDIRSVLRWLNNNVEKKVKPTELASMKHGKCEALIQEQFKTSDIEKALDAFASGDNKKPKAEKKPTTKPVTESVTNVIAENAISHIEDGIAKLEAVIRKLKTSHSASYVLRAGLDIFVIAAGPNGACVIEDGFKSIEDAHKEWPEAILPGPISNEADLKDLL